MPVVPAVPTVRAAPALLVVHVVPVMGMCKLGLLLCQYLSNFISIIF